MYLCRYESAAVGPRLGIVDPEAERITALRTDVGSLEDALADGASFEETDETLELADVSLRAPVERPANLIGIGLNYANHAAEGGNPVPDEPLFFAKSSSSLAHPNSAVVKHPEVSDLHYEGELAVVVGSAASHIDETDALECVFGYTAANDVTAREMQHADLDAANPWFRSKSMATFTPLGPWVRTLDGCEVDLATIDIETRLNDETVQSSSTSDFIFPVAEAVAYVSHHIALQPGDVLLTGTPAGVGGMEPGDRITVELGGLGTLSNTVEEP